MSDTTAGRETWQRLSTTVVHTSPWFEVRRDEVIRPEGDPGEYQHVVSPGGVTVLAITDDDLVVFTRQWIYTHGGPQWRLPSGGLSFGGASPLLVARRELAEETGYKSANWISLGRVHGADSLSNHVDHIFLATSLIAGPARLQPGECDLEVHFFPFPEAVSMVLRGEVPHSASAYALLAQSTRRLGERR
jgi:8-oxo-dGTP pyrophosphatase MutT (NUDIX family)